MTGAPGPSWGARPPLAIRHDDLVIGYRVRAPDLPYPGPGAGGWLIAWQSANPFARPVDAMAARPGAVLVLGEDDVLDIRHPGPLTVEVLSFDASTVRLRFSRREARPPADPAASGCRSRAAYPPAARV